MAEPSGMLADIVEPAAPLAPTADGTAWLLLLAGLLAALGAVWWWRGRRRRRALGQLVGLRRAYRSGSLTGRETAYLLAELLRQHSRLARLAADAPPAGWRERGRTDWNGFVLRLDLLRYSPEDAGGTGDIEKLFSQAETWLRNAG